MFHQIAKASISRSLSWHHQFPRGIDMNSLATNAAWWSFEQLFRHSFTLFWMNCTSSRVTTYWTTSLNFEFSECKDYTHDPKIAQSFRQAVTFWITSTVKMSKRAFFKIVGSACKRFLLSLSPPPPLAFCSRPNLCAKRPTRSIHQQQHA